MKRALLFLLAAALLVAQTPIVHAGTSYYHIVPSSAPAIVKAVSGTLFKVVVNTAGQGCSLTMLDSAGSGGASAIIGVVNCSAQGALEYNIAFQNGLTLLMTGSGADATITYQ